LYVKLKGMEIEEIKNHLEKLSIKEMQINKINLFVN
jgi:hypothetical protein